MPIDEINEPRGTPALPIRVPPTESELDVPFGGWREDLLTCRKFATMARSLDLDHVKWHLGRFGKLHVRFGKGARGPSPEQRLVPLSNGADRTLRRFIEDIWAHFGDGWDQSGAPLFPSNGEMSTAPTAG